VRRGDGCPRAVMHNAASERTETRGMHKVRIIRSWIRSAAASVCWWLAEVWNGIDPERPYSALELAR